MDLRVLDSGCGVRWCFLGVVRVSDLSLQDMLYSSCGVESIAFATTAALGKVRQVLSLH